ncbi:hypothetical protein Hanom_Chr01g00025681 [Helianthus anomalus]
MQDPLVDLDGPVMPQPSAPVSTTRFPGHAPGATADPQVRAELDKLNDLIGWLFREAQDRRERERERERKREGGYPPYRSHYHEHHSSQIQIRTRTRSRRHRPAAWIYFGI